MAAEQQKENAPASAHQPPQSGPFPKFVFSKANLPSGAAGMSDRESPLGSSGAAVPKTPSPPPNPAPRRSGQGHGKPRHQQRGKGGRKKPRGEKATFTYQERKEGGKRPRGTGKKGGKKNHQAGTSARPDARDSVVPPREKAGFQANCAFVQLDVRPQLGEFKYWRNKAPHLAIQCPKRTKILCQHPKARVERDICEVVCNADARRNGYFRISCGGRVSRQQRHGHATDDLHVLAPIVIPGDDIRNRDIASGDTATAYEEGATASRHTVGAFAELLEKRSGQFEVYQQRDKAVKNSALLFLDASYYVPFEETMRLAHAADARAIYVSYHPLEGDRGTYFGGEYHWRRFTHEGKPYIEAKAGEALYTHPAPDWENYPYLEYFDGQMRSRWQRVELLSTDSTQVVKFMRFPNDLKIVLRDPSSQLLKVEKEELKEAEDSEVIDVGDPSSMVSLASLLGSEAGDALGDEPPSDADDDDDEKKSPPRSVPLPALSDDFCRERSKAIVVPRGCQLSESGKWIVSGDTSKAVEKAKLLAIASEHISRSTSESALPGILRTTRRVLGPETPPQTIAWVAQLVATWGRPTANVDAERLLDDDAGEQARLYDDRLINTFRPSVMKEGARSWVLMALLKMMAITILRLLGFVSQFTFMVSNGFSVMVLVTVWMAAKRMWAHPAFKVEPERPESAAKAYHRIQVPNVSYTTSWLDAFLLVGSSVSHTVGDHWERVWAANPERRYARRRAATS